MSEHFPDSAIRPVQDGVYLNVHAQPGARRCELRGMHGDAVKIAVQVAARDGKANQALLRYIANALHLPLQCIEMVSGHRARSKRVFITGDATDLNKRLQKWLHDA